MLPMPWSRPATPTWCATRQTRRTGSVRACPPSTERARVVRCAPLRHRRAALICNRSVRDSPIASWRARIHQRRRTGHAQRYRTCQLRRGRVVERTETCCTRGMSHESRRLAGILLVVLPTVMYGGATLLDLLTRDPRYMQNALREDLWRAG